MMPWSSRDPESAAFIIDTNGASLAALPACIGGKTFGRFSVRIVCALACR